MKSAAPPPLNALRAFEAFARHGGMTAAAAELCVTHGAVSRQVAALQAHLGVTLVVGPRHRLTLTPAGAELAVRLTGAPSQPSATPSTPPGATTGARSKSPASEPSP